MALLEIQGFDHQSNATDLIADVATANAPWVWSILTLTGTVLGAGRFTGTKALYLGSTGIFGGKSTTPFSSDTAILGCALRVPNTGSALIGFWDSATQNPTSGTMQLSVLLTGSTGVITIYRGSTSGTLLYTSAGNQFPRNTYFYFEIKAKIHASAGTVDIHIKGSPYLSLTGLNTQAGATSLLDGIFLGGGGLARVDDLYIADTTAGLGANPFSTFQGQPTGGLRVFTRFPSAAGAEIDFTPLTGTNTSQVQEHAMDSDVSYNWDAGTLLDEDLFAADATPVGAAPLACKVQGSYREAGSSRMWDLVNKLRSGTTQFKGDPVTLFPTYTYQADIYPQNPDGSVAWTKSAVDASQIGYEVVSSTIIEPPPATEPLRVVGTAGISTAVDHSIPTVTFNLTTAHDDCIVVVHVILNAEGASGQDQFPGEVTTITGGGGVTWFRRARVLGQRFSGFIFGDAFVNSELWWTVAPNVLTNEPIVVHVNSELSFITATAIAISGCDTVSPSPWDTNISLPVSAVHLNGPTIQPEVTGVSTDSADSIVLWIFDEFTAAGLPNGPPGYSRGPGGQNINAFIGLIIEDCSFYYVYDAPLVNATLTEEVGSGFGAGATGPLPSWMILADALRAA